MKMKANLRKKSCLLFPKKPCELAGERQRESEKATPVGSGCTSIPSPSIVPPFWDLGAHASHGSGTHTAQSPGGSQLPSPPCHQQAPLCLVGTCTWLALQTQTEEPSALPIYGETALKMQEDTEFMNEEKEIPEIETKPCW